MMNYLVEIGCEEIPARFVKDLVDQWRKAVENSFHEEGITFEFIAPYATYRRIALYIQGLPLHQEDREDQIKGPPEKIAVDELGQLTQAGKGFLKKQGIEKGEFKDGYLWARVLNKGRSLKEILPEIMTASLKQLYLPVSMKWGEEKQEFIRPVHWIVSLADDQMIPFEFAGQMSGQRSFGHRFLTQGNSILGAEIQLINASDYVDELLKNKVMVGIESRKEAIFIEISTLQGHGIVDDELLNEVNFLVEWPKVLQGTFDKEFLKVPAKILTTTMEKHQRYFALSKNGKIEPAFLVVADNINTQNQAQVVQGNERVLRARLYDAKFYYDEDIKHGPEYFLKALETITYHQELGTIAQKVARHEQIAEYFKTSLKLKQTSYDQLQEIIKICKADLATAMVFEFTELQGYVGEQYALVWGLSAEIAKGVREHYLPAFAGDDLPSTQPAALASLVDKLDSICGHFKIGNIPSGSADPYALRRQANGVIRIGLETDFFSVNLEETLKWIWTRPLSGIGNEGQDITGLYQFFLQRIEQWLRDQGLPHDQARAIKSLDLPKINQRLEWMKKLWARDQIKEMVDAIVRIFNITKNIESDLLKSVDPFLFEDAAERSFFDAYNTLAKNRNKWDDKTMADWFALIPVINEYFDQVMVMANDDAIKTNRLSFLYTVREYFADFAAFGELQI